MTDEPERTSAGRLAKNWLLRVLSRLLWELQEGAKDKA